MVDCVVASVVEVEPWEEVVELEAAVDEDEVVPRLEVDDDDDEEAPELEECELELVPWGPNRPFVLAK